MTTSAVPFSLPGDEHGTRATYRQGCRCLPCRVAASDYLQSYRREIAMGRPPMIPAEAARAHLEALTAAGVGTYRIAQLANLARSTVLRILSQRVTTIHRDTEAAILRVKPSLAPHACVSGYDTRQKLKTLIAEGFETLDLAKVLGLHPRWFVRHDTKQVRVRTALRMRALFRRVTSEEEAG